MSIIIKLIQKSIKKNKKQYQLSFVVLCITMFVLLGFITFMNHQEQVNIENQKDKYGNWYFMSKDLDAGNTVYLQSQGIASLTVPVVDDVLSSYSKDYMDMYHIHIQKGRKPKNKNEVVSSNPNDHINDTITIQAKQYKVVGILNNYSKDVNVPCIEYFTTSLKSKHTYTYFIYSNKLENLLKKNVIKGIYNQQVYTSLSINEDNVVNLNDSMFIHLRYLTAIMVIGTTLIFILIYLLRVKEFKQLTLLSMTTKQLSEYIFIENIFLLSAALLASIVLCLVFELLLAVIAYCMYQKFVYTLPVRMLFTNAGVYIVLLVIILLFSIIIYNHYDEQKEKKKYHCFKHKVFKMNIPGISLKELLEHKVLSIVVIAVMVVTGTYCNQLLIDIGVPTSLSYQYEIKSDSSLNAKNQFIYSAEFLVKEDTILYLFEKDEQSYYSDEILLDGRYPENANECVYIQGKFDLYDVGDHITLHSDEGYNYPTEVVGVIKEDALSNYSEYYDESGAILINECDYYTKHYVLKLTSSNNIYYPLLQKYGNCTYTATGNNTSYIFYTKLLYSISFSFMILYLCSLIYFYIYHIQKDLNIMRVFALSKKDNIKIIMIMLSTLTILSLLCLSHMYNITVLQVAYLLALICITSILMVPDNIQIKTGERL